MSTLEERYLRGELDFEAAAAEATGHHLDRDDLLPLLGVLRQALGVAELSDHDTALYDDAGFVEAPVAGVALATDREQRMRTLTSTALTVRDAADLLRVSPSRVRQRTAAGSLWALKVDNKLVLPRVQFTPTGLVPGLEKILAAVPQGLHPLSLEGLLTEPHTDLAVEGRPASIVQWLRSGGDPAAAFAVVEAFDHAPA